MFSFKNMGIVGVIMAVLAFLFRDNPLMQSLLGFFTGKETASADKAKVAPVSGTQGQQGVTQAAAISPAQAQAQPPVTLQMPPQEIASRTMADWKQQMEAQHTPDMVRQALLAREYTLNAQFAASAAEARNDQQLQEKLLSIQMTALSDVTKPQLNAFLTKAENQVGSIMDQIIREISLNTDLPAKEKAEALKALRMERANLLEGLKNEVEKMPLEQRIALALSPEAQEKILQQQAGGLTARKEELSKNISEISRHNSGWAWGSSILGWTSAGLAVGGLVAAPFTGGLSLGLTAAACGTGIGAGACRVMNNRDKGGSNFEFGMGFAEMALNAIPLGGLAAKSVGLFGKSVTVAAETTGVFSAVSKASIVEGRAITAVDAALTNSAYKGAASISPAVKKAAIQEVTQALKGTEGAIVSMPAGEAADLAKQALLQAQRSDPFIGSYTNAWRATTEIGYTTTDETLDTLKPSPTPKNQTPGAPSKTTLVP